MQKRRKKVDRLAAEAASILARSGNVAAAARSLGIDRKTLHRWIRAGHVSRPTRAPRVVPAASGPAEGPTEATGTAVTWRAWLDERFELTPTEVQTADLAAIALAMGRDAALAPAVRLGAMARFSALVRELNLEVDDGSIAKTPNPRIWPRAVGRAAES